MALYESTGMVPWWFILVFVLIFVFNITRFLHRRGYINIPCCGRRAQPAVAVELGAPPASQFMVSNGTSLQQHQPPTYNYSYGQQPPPVAFVYGVSAPPPPAVAPAQHPAVTYASQQQQPPVATAQHPAVTYAYGDSGFGRAPDLGPGGYSR